MKLRNLTFSKRAGLFSILCLLAGSLVLTSCSNSEEDDNADAAILAAALNNDGRSHNALVNIPPSIASATDATLSASSMNGEVTAQDAIPQGPAATSLKGVYAPVRLSIYIGDKLIDLGGMLITSVEHLLVVYPGLVSGEGSTVSFDDESDSMHPGRVIKLSTSTTFGAKGRKIEMWYSDTGSDPLRDGKKFIELDYRYHDTDDDDDNNYSSAERANIDGVMFVRYLPEERSTEYTNIRLEFQKQINTSNEVTRKAWIQIQNHLNLNWDDKNANGNSVFYITEDNAGTVTVEGGYSATGIKMPFMDNWTADATNWGENTERAYLFNATGSAAIGKGVVNVILPLRSQSAALAGTSTPFADTQNWSLGELFTDGFLTWCANEPVSVLSATNILELLNLLQDEVTLTTASTQAEVQTALNDININDPNAQYCIQQLQVVTGVLNPVYFLRTSGFFRTSTLIGQDDLDGIDPTGFIDLESSLKSWASNPGASSVDQLDFQYFTSVEDMYTLDIAAGTNIVVISGHPAGIQAWSGINDTP